MAGLMPPILAGPPAPPWKVCRDGAAWTSGKTLCFQTVTFPAPPNFRKLIFGGIEEKQRVEGGQKGLFFARRRLDLRRDRLTDSFNRAPRDEEETT